jgi:hypothetical protein
LEESDGALVTTGDGPPMGGAFPTSMWRPGDVVLDVHRIPARVEAHDAGQVVTVGWYRSQDGTRLPAWIDGVPIADGAVSIWPNLP